MKTIFYIFTLSLFLFTDRLSAQKNLAQLSYEKIDSMIGIYFEQEDFENLLAYSLAGKEKALAQFGNQDSTYANYLVYVAYCKEFNEQAYSEAAAILQEIIKIRKKTLGDKHPEYATSLNDLATLYYKMGRYEEAETLYLQTIEIDKQLLGAKTPEFAVSLNNLAALYESMGRYEQAEQIHLQTLKIYKEAFGEKHTDYAVSLNNLALLYQAMRFYEQAEPLFVQSLAINKQNYGEKHPTYALSLNNLAVLYQNMEQYEQAEKLYIEALNIRKEVLGDKHKEYAYTLNNLAALYKAMGGYEKAELMYLEAIRIQATLLGKKHPEYAQSLNNLAVLYRLSKKEKETERLYLEALAIFKETLGERHHNYNHALNNLAQLYLESKQIDKALYYTELALTSASGLNISCNITKAWADSLSGVVYSSNQQLNNMIVSLKILFDLAEINPDKNAKAQQLILAELAAKLLKTARDSYADDKDKLRVLAQSNDWILRSLKLLDKKNQAAQAFEIAEQNKSVLLSDAAKAEMALNFGELPDSLARQEKKLQKKLSGLQAALLEKHSDEEKELLINELNELNIKIKKFKSDIEQKYPKYAALKYRSNHTAAKEIQAALAPKTALLEYVIGEDVVYIFYLDKETIRWIEQPISTAVLKTNIKKLHDALSNYEQLKQYSEADYSEYCNTAYWFYDQLLKPVLNTAKKPEALIIIPDGELAHLPFEVFLTAPVKNNEINFKNLPYLLEQFSISYNYSAGLWKENNRNRKTKNNGLFFAMAGDYSSESSTQLLADLRTSAHRNMRDVLAPLPEARKEVAALQENFAGFFGFDSLATEHNFKEKAGEYGIIHLAMHGLLNQKSPILSSLAFSEDGDSVENNFLQAYEISKMQLNADLVVLSACETGYGKFEKGNGTASLARAFMYAGVPAMVVSLWQVNDASTSTIMQLFYKNLSKGMNKAAALQKAKLDYIKTVGGDGTDAINRISNPIAAHPAFWAAFIQIGDSRPIKIASKNEGKIWWIVGGIALLALGGGYLALRKRKNT